MPNVNGIQTRSEWIELRKPTEMSSMYEGRGVPATSKVFPAGTKAHYSTFPFNGEYAARAGEPITHWVHRITVREGRTTYTATKRTQA